MMCLVKNKSSTKITFLFYTLQEKQPWEVTQGSHSLLAYVPHKVVVKRVLSRCLPFCHP